MYVSFAKNRIFYQTFFFSLNKHNISFDIFIEMDGRAFYESVKSFCQSRGGPYVNVQQHRQHGRGRRPVRRGAVAATAAASASDAVAQNRFTQAAGQPTKCRVG